MLVLQAIRLDVFERFQYRVDAPGEPPFLTSNPDEVAAKLAELGVPDPARLVAHVRAWGIIEIAD